MKASALILLSLFAVSCSGIKAPVQENNYVNIYKPVGDYFTSASTKTYKQGTWYDSWVPNDHCFIKGDDGVWHMFGITHPEPPTMKSIHEGEHQSFHAISPTTDFKGSLGDGAWIDKDKILTTIDRPGEIAANHAPYVVKNEDTYYMVYGHAPMRLATSKDLYYWQPQGKIFYDNGEDTRDPNLFFHDGVYYISYCTKRKVAYRRSRDLMNWSEPQTIFETRDFDPESPSIVLRKGVFYLFVCGWDKDLAPAEGLKEIADGYQHKTYVYATKDLKQGFDSRKLLTTLNSHAPEVFQDERGDWYISSAEYPYRGVNVDRLRW